MIPTLTTPGFYRETTHRSGATIPGMVLFHDKQRLLAFVSDTPTRELPIGLQRFYNFVLTDASITE
jgi:hypothetical protein